MMKELEPQIGYATMHFVINAVRSTVKMGADFNSSPAYEDGTPKDAPGVQKGPVAAAAFAAEKKEFAKYVKDNLGIVIGKFGIIFSFLSI